MSSIKESVATYERRTILGLMVGAATLVANRSVADVATSRSAQGSNAMHDFDFLFGQWSVQHRRLKSRLTGSTEWETFSGSSQARPILGGFGNVDDNVLELPGGTYAAASIRLFDASKSRWSIWWLDSRVANIDAPVHGTFAAGLGIFYGEDELRGKPVHVRFLWSGITAQSAQWQQAFSPDGGASWETNWIMDFQRRL